MWTRMIQIKKTASTKRKSGFGIMEVMVSILVLGLLYMALNQLQKSNDEAVHRLRCRDGAVQVAQEILDSLKGVGISSIASAADRDTTVKLDERVRTWNRALTKTPITVNYAPELTISKTEDYVAKNSSNYENNQHIIAKQVNVKVVWRFKGQPQSINVSGVIR